MNMKIEIISNMYKLADKIRLEQIVNRALSFIVLVILSTVLNSCFDTELPIQPYPRGDVRVRVIPMSPEYTNQIYYNFETDSILKENARDSWDIAFQSYGEDYYIILNGSKLMEAADMGSLAFESVKSREEAAFKYDSTNGKFDDYSIGKWWVSGIDTAISTNNIYIINRGRNIDGKRAGYVKMQILSAGLSGYYIRFADLDGKNDTTQFIPRVKDYNYVMFSFDNGGIVEYLEPNRNDWDILFTRFVAFLPYNNSLLPYGVTGVMINHTLTEVTSDSLRTFSEISINDIGDYTFTNSPGFIGHEWKNFDLNGELYTAKDYVTYIFKDVYGFYWKFRFIDFYNDDKQRGYPKFEFVKL